MNYQDLIFLDFETTGVNPLTCQPTQLSAVVIHGRKLEVVEDSMFHTYIQPIFDEDKCMKLGLEPVSDEVLIKTHLDIDTLKAAPKLKTAWSQFQQFVARFNPKKSKWGAPIKAGMNIDRYDSIIIDRIAGGHFRHVRSELDKLHSGGIIPIDGSWMTARAKNELESWSGAEAPDSVHEFLRRISNEKAIKLPDPYGFGPWDDKRQEETLFYPRDSVDLLRIIWMWTENIPEIKSLSMDAIREWLGISTEGAHDARKDVVDGAKVLIKFLKLHRTYAPKIKFKDSCAKNF
jgi:DNA polymerase III epsilon subunit-like protein